MPHRVEGLTEEVLGTTDFNRFFSTPALARYQNVSFLGKGGMGTVFKAHDTVLDRLVAFKIFLRHPQSHRQLAERFAREARAMAAITHPNVVAIFDHGTIDDQQYLILEYIEGQNLDLYLDEGLPALRQGVAWLATLFDALAAIHAAGIIHRDIKPANIMVSPEGTIRLMDLGLVRFMDTESLTALTKTGQVVGTLPYMPPEFLTGHTASAASDVYQLGCVAYELFTGRRAMSAPSPFALLQSKQGWQFPPPSSLDKRIDSSLDDFVLSCLAKETKDRPPSALAARDELLAWLDEHEEKTTHRTSSARTSRSKTNRPATASRAPSSRATASRATASRATASRAPSSIEARPRSRRRLILSAFTVFLLALFVTYLVNTHMYRFSQRQSTEAKKQPATSRQLTAAGKAARTLSDCGRRLSRQLTSYLVEHESFLPTNRQWLARFLVPTGGNITRQNDRFFVPLSIAACSYGRPCSLSEREVELIVRDLFARSTLSREDLARFYEQTAPLIIAATGPDSPIARRLAPVRRLASALRHLRCPDITRWAPPEEMFGVTFATSRAHLSDLACSLTLPWVEGTVASDKELDRQWLAVVERIGCKKPPTSSHQWILDSTRQPKPFIRFELFDWNERTVLYVKIGTAKEFPLFLPARLPHPPPRRVEDKTATGQETVLPCLLVTFPVPKECDSTARLVIAVRYEATLPGLANPLVLRLNPPTLIEVL